MTPFREHYDPLSSSMRTARAKGEGKSSKKSLLCKQYGSDAAAQKVSVPGCSTLTDIKIIAGAQLGLAFVTDVVRDGYALNGSEDEVTESNHYAMLLGGATHDSTLLWSILVIVAWLYR